MFQKSGPLTSSPMPRLQFSIRTLLWLTLVVAVGFALVPPLVRNYAPKWGKPSSREIGPQEIEIRWPTGRVHRYKSRYVSVF